jgi:hypothetical protein
LTRLSRYVKLPTETQATRAMHGPYPQSPNNNRKDGTMHATTPPLFSEFMALKRANPNQYWLPVTAAQMAKAYIHHGPAYFDLHKDQSL